MKKIDAADLKQFLQKLPDSSLLMIDVRTPEEYNAEHIDNTHNLPLVDLLTKPKDFTTYKTIVVLAKTKDEALKACKAIALSRTQELYYSFGSIDSYVKSGIRTIKSH